MAKGKRQKEQTLKVRVRVLGIDSSFEPATLAAYQYREKHVYPYIQSKGYTVDKCQGPMARRIYVAPAAVASGVVYITGVGHGSHTIYTGCYYDPIFQVGCYAAAEPAGKIVHLLSCETARDLGPDFVKNGAWRTLPTTTISSSRGATKMCSSSATRKSIVHLPMD